MNSKEYECKECGYDRSAQTRKVALIEQKVVKVSNAEWADRIKEKYPNISPEAFVAIDQSWTQRQSVKKILEIRNKHLTLYNSDV